ncbi:DUF998 domain-containing protein [Occultella glacieicola]|uniref:DUF998 domain-containing protein n=1 Tax=Occultella glacieicola TaxID=2518684 RepID=A0ABY2E0T7_9MICO|nr:DUF998 domain-containing protein [Occultella glacieicola]TDE91571.1 DUF998 domain-containing protein [Occultella glacieicola]
MNGTSTTNTAPTAEGTHEQRVTRSLLGYGILAGPFYVVVSLTQAVVHDGFDLTRHDWSLLAAGPQGWIQMVNLILTGAMVIAFAVGVARSWTSRWAPRLLGIYGLGLIAAGVFVADPMAGYPVGSVPVTEISWHGLGHMVAGMVGFAGLIAATFVVARVQAREGRRGAAWASRAVGVIFLAGFAGVATGSSAPAIVLGFTAAVVISWAWLAALAAHLQHRVAAPRC